MSTLEQSAPSLSWETPKPTAVIVLADGTTIYGQGAGASGVAEAEICFNTAITGYQEILTDPSYAGQIVTFTFPHIGNVGTNEEDYEDLEPENKSDVVGAIFKSEITAPSNFRSTSTFDAWLKARGIIALYGVDTRALTAYIRENGLANAVIAHNEDGEFDIDSLAAKAKAWNGLEGQDLALPSSSDDNTEWLEQSWVWDEGYSNQENAEHHIVAIDFGIKRNILRLIADLGCKVTVVPAQTSAEKILALNPDGIFISNGPGDPAATGEYAVPIIQKLIESDVPIFGICLGHQILSLALGAKTVKMHQGHHGANHPVKDHTTGKVEIVSMNHGFAVDSSSLPDHVKETHVSLFDDTNCGIALKGKPVFSVQHHPEASPGPQDSHYLFTRFIDLIKAHKKQAA